MAIIELKHLPRQILNSIKGMLVEMALPLFLLGICFFIGMILIKCL